MDVGQLDRRALIESPTETRDGYGALIPGWAAVCSVWCAVQPIAGAERLVMGTGITSEHFRVTIRYRTDITNKCRVTIDGSKVAVVHSHTEIGRREWTELICERAK
jgi:SPP1 family predicted phage head-tail adaptor